MLKFKKCAGAEDTQSVNSERDINMTDSERDINMTDSERDINMTDSERDINMTDSERDINMTDSWWTASALNTADTEEYRQRMTHWTVHTLNATDTELTLNAIDSEPHWQLNTRLNTTDTE